MLRNEMQNQRSGGRCQLAVTFVLVLSFQLSVFLKLCRPIVNILADFVLK